MDASDVILAAAFGAIFLAISVSLWAVFRRRRDEATIAELTARLRDDEASACAMAAVEAAGGALICIDGGKAEIAAGEQVLEGLARALSVPPTPMAVIDSVIGSDPGHRRKLQALFTGGEAFSVEARAGGKTLRVEGGPAGALAWVRLTPSAPQAAYGADRFADVLNAGKDPMWVARSDGAVVWANQAWLRATEAASVEDAVARNLSFDRASDALVAEAAGAGEARESLRWLTFGGQRRAFRIAATPLENGDVGVTAFDVTDAEALREAVRRQTQAHDETLDHIADAVAIFDGQKRISFHNRAFAQLWELEPAWLAEGPSHAELLDRLRQRRRLPETANYAEFKGRELSHYESLQQGPEELWNLPDGKTLKVVRQAHPMGGILIIYSDITGELRLKAQYKALVQVHQATLDKLNDAVAVFASDGRLRLHNEAFERFWHVTPTQLTDAGDFEGVAELCTPRLHDQAFWQDLKGRVADTDPRARIPTGGETRTADDRIVAWQSRPLPDGATLIAFADVTDTKKLEKAVKDRSAALDEAQRLKKDFVGNVSYELRTPLTTIIGYSELLDFQGETLPTQARSHVASVRTAATQLARSIDDVLDMAQIDAGEMALDLGDVAVRDLLDNVASRFSREAADAGVSVELVCEDSVGLIRADSHRLAQVLDHLMENALRQSPKGQTVTLAARRAASEITIQIQDRGRGIPFHVQATIFDRFVSRESGGPGLGLALVKALVELHGGWVALESEPGAGATFTLHLPETAYQDSAGQPELFWGREDAISPGFAAVGRLDG
jgi:hypothetical protein